MKNSRKSCILMITPRFSPDKGGVENHVERVSSQLIREGHEVTVLTQTENDDVSCDEVINGLRIYRFKHSGLVRILKMTRLAKWIWLSKNLDKLLKYDVIHCHDFTVFWNWYLPFRFILFWKPVFVTFHGWEGVFPPKKLVVVKRWIVSVLANGNICIGDYISKWYNTKATIVSYGAVDKPIYPIKSDDNRDFVFLGRLERDTGVQSFLEAIYQLAPARRRRITIVGDGSLRPEIENFCREMSLEYQLVGWQADPSQYYGTGTIVFVTGYLGILETLAAGCRVIAFYDNPLKRDYLAMMPVPQGSLRIAGDVEDLVRHISFVQDHEEQAMTQAMNGSKWALEQTWEKLGRKYRELWTMK